MKKLTASVSLAVTTTLVVLLTACTGQNGDKTGKQDNPAVQSWRVIGPGGGGGVLLPTISPFNGNFVLTHCDMTGVYVTSDGGASWKMKNVWNVPDDFEFDPIDSNTVYVATRGFLHSEDRGSGISLVLRSSDRGASWNIIYPDVSAASKVERLQSTSMLPSMLIPGAIDGTVQKVDVSSSDNSHIYLGIAPLVDYMTRGGAEGNSFVTLASTYDHGKTWKTLATLPGKTVKALFAPGKEKKAIVITESGFFSVDETSGSVERREIPASGILSADGGRGSEGGSIYLVTRMNNGKGRIEGGIYRSDNEGRSWMQVNSGLSEGVAPGMALYVSAGFAVCESKPSTAYLSAIRPVMNKAGEPEAVYAIYKTTDGGKSWAPVLLSSTPGGYITSNFSGSWMEESFDPGWGGNPIDLGVAPGNPDICYAGDNGRGYKTTDGGKTWTQVYSRNNADGSYSSTGLDVTTCYGVHFDPFDNRHFFICYTDIGLFHTFNAGESWYHSITGIPRDWQNTCYQVAFDPAVKGRVWSVWANAHDLPRTKMFGGTGFDDYLGGVAVSDDGGKTWTTSNRGLPPNSICTNILLDEKSPADSRKMYVSVFDKGIYRSSDGGKSWEKACTGLGDNLFAWQLRINSQGRLYSLFSRGQRNEATVDGAVYYSDDAAANWNRLSLPEGVSGPHDLLVDQADANVLYLSCWPRTVNGADVKGGLLKSVDGGKNWTQVYDERVRVNSAAMDPEDHDLIYLNTFQNEASRSTDGGQTWSAIKGYRFKWGQRAIPDPVNRGMLYLTTYGGSVYYGPGSGTTVAGDDIRNMPEGWW